jgi:hypothetical protein
MLTLPLALGAQPRAIPAPVLGVTLDDVSDLPAILSSLARLPRKPTVRVVFDAGVPAARYKDAVRTLHAKAFVMGELLDSSAMKSVGLEDYRSRAGEYLSALGADVDVWEVGNELNGEWLGADAESKAAAAFDAVKAAGGRTALTLFYNEGCWEKPENEMFRWTAERVPRRLRDGVDYALLSWYEDECHGLRPDWTKVFARLGALFPRAGLGFGEIGTKKESGKAAMIRRFYGMRPPSPRFVGGYFWWFFKEDMVPEDAPLLKDISAASAGAPR